MKVYISVKNGKHIARTKAKLEQDRRLAFIEKLNDPDAFAEFLASLGYKNMYSVFMLSDSKCEKLWDAWSLACQEAVEKEDFALEIEMEDVK